MMKQRIQIYTLILIISLLLFSGCTQTTPAETNQAEQTSEEEIIVTEEEAPEVEAPTEVPPSATPEPTLTNTPEPTPTSTPRTILLEDDFSDVGSGWERYRQFDGVLDYLEEDEVYQMQLPNEDNFFWVSLDTTYLDLALTVEAAQMAGPEGSMFGVLCRYDDADLTSVVFAVTSDGQAGVGTIENFAFQPLPGGELASFDVINTGLGAVNTLEASCVGQQLIFMVNDALLFDLTAPDLVGDDIGLFVDSSQGGGVDVYFDNLIIYQP